MRLAVFALLLVACQDPEQTPSGVVDNFYHTTMSMGLSGAPTPGDMVGLSPYLSDSLREMLVAARRQHDADVARAPDEKPAFADGSLFSSLFEGPTSVSIEGDSTTDDGHFIRVSMRYSAAGDTAVTTWIDVVHVIMERGRFVIRDIEYRGDWDFANKGTLRAMLSGSVP